MKYNNGLETRKYLRRMAVLERLFREAGCSEEDINEMKEYDWNVKKKERNYAEHTQLVPEIKNYESDEQLDGWEVMASINPMTCTCEHEAFVAPEYWLENIEDERLYRALTSLDESEQMIIMLIFVYSFKQKDVAELLGISESVMSKRFRKIRNKMLKFK